MPSIQDIMAMVMSGGQKYPSQEEIMGTPHTHKPEVIKLVKSWKREYWKNVKGESDEQKFIALKALLQRIASEAYQRPVEVDYQPDVPSCCYHPQMNRITVNKSLSIISSLHELAHHLFGPSELKACRWSVWLFKKTFPKAYDQLEWRGHMLVKRACSVS